MAKHPDQYFRDEANKLAHQQYLWDKLEEGATNTTRILLNNMVIFAEEIYLKWISGNNPVSHCRHSHSPLPLPSPSPTLQVLDVHLKNLKGIKKTYSDFQEYQRILKWNMYVYEKLDKRKKGEAVDQVLQRLKERCTTSDETRLAVVRLGSLFGVCI